MECVCACVRAIGPPAQSPGAWRPWQRGPMAVVVPAVLEVHLPLRLWASRPEEQGPPDVPRRR